ncbi:MAG TPA: hypothetical protein DCY13_10595 [Verrucomicrobiales bacterium]|nr:hypothetical protein [Verrucomicrobiales bacterium]
MPDPAAHGQVSAGLRSRIGIFTRRRVCQNAAVPRSCVSARRPARQLNDRPVAGFKLPMPLASPIRALGSLLLLAAWLGLPSNGPLRAETGVSFNRQIRPLLSDRCFKCHGPDEQSREGRLRLDTQEGSRKALDDGWQVILPGEPHRSELVRRIFTDDPDDVMPPPDSNLKLSAEEKELLKQWVAGGGDYERHWAFNPVPREVPMPANGQVHPIDAFVVERLGAAELKPAPEATRETLIRRLSLDLTGLPPSLAEVREFVEDTRPDAYERLVDRLLASPHYGEQRAVDWIDLARYADTYGYQADVEMEMSPWRDWVIRAFNDNLPYDDFIKWQIAGDLLPNATRDQILATAFNRLHRQTNEGGSIDEEFRVEYVSDRVHTFGTSLLGLTLECARCHDHKYDPFSIRDYYRLFAYFNHAPQETEYLNEKSQATLRFKGPYLTFPGERVVNTDPQDPDDAEKGERVKQSEIRHYQRTLIMLDSEPRATHVLNRGSFLDPGEPVTAGTPALFTPLPDAPTNRLGLARWLVSEANPLTARVIVNRIWAELFGSGIVATPEDFGIKGDAPSHPELLDWLAVELVSSEWDMKQLLHTLVTSRTFQQAGSRHDSALAQQVDPLNRLLWHFPRQRLSAETVQDNALAIAGLLSRKQFGPPVRPPQPEGLWRKVGGQSYDYHPSEGEDRHRRGLYAIRKRGSMHPSLAAFDASSRTACVVQRRVSNTPLQALTLLNDPVHVEAAAAFARRLLEHPGETSDKIAHGFRLCTARTPTPGESRVLGELLHDSRAAYSSRGHAEPGNAAWRDLATALLNLDETITLP